MVWRRGETLFATAQQFLVPVRRAGRGGLALAPADFGSYAGARRDSAFIA